MKTLSYWSALARAAGEAAFAQRGATALSAVMMFGNNLMVCAASASGCTDSRAGRNSLNNNSFNMVHLDVDGAAFLHGDVHLAG